MAKKDRDDYVVETVEIDARDKAMVVTLHGGELTVKMYEAFYGIEHPASMTLQQAYDHIAARDPVLITAMERCAQCALDYFIAHMVGATPQGPLQ